MALWLVGLAFVPNFANPDNLTSILRQSSFVGISAIGMTMAIIAGLFDLSVGSTLALAAWASVLVASATGSPLAALLAAVAIGMIVGSINGFFVTVVRIPAFITTLGMLFIVAGVTLILTNGEAARYNGPDFIWWGNAAFGFVPVPFAVFIAVRARRIGGTPVHIPWQVSVRHRIERPGCPCGRRPDQHGHVPRLRRGGHLRRHQRDAARIAPLLGRTRAWRPGSS